MIVADTDVLVDALRGAEPSRTRLEEALASGALATTAVSAFELMVGAKTAKQTAAVSALLAALTILPVDAPASGRAAEVCRTLGDDGKGIGTRDGLVAGICLEHSGELLTRNRAHFERVIGLRLAVMPN